MKGFKILTNKNQEIRFGYYDEEAPVTCQAFDKILPFTRIFYHAKMSGQEIWIDNLPPVNIIQENASINVLPGEVVLGPSNPSRLKTKNCFGVYYGEGKGIDATNIFARVVEEDSIKLFELGDAIWKNGGLELLVTRLD